MRSQAARSRDCDAKSTGTSSVARALRSPARPLDAATRAALEPRFGFDLSAVRVHAGSVAADESSRAMRAWAYTVGEDVIFRAGEYAPSTSRGRDLIAHELAHVAEQAGGAPMLQRAPDDKPPKPPTPPPAASQDVAVVMADQPGLFAAATLLAPGATVLRANSVEELVKQLKTIKGPVKTVYFFAHMTDDGNLMFETPGTQTYVPAQEIADKVKGTVQADDINFQGCNIGQAPKDMERIAGALKATRATGSTCTLVEQLSDPVKVNGKPILRPEQLMDKTVKTAFEKGLKDLRKLFVDKKKNCILNDSVDGYFKAGGRLLAYWANPESMADSTGWDDTKSVCYTNLKTVKLDLSKKLPVIDPDDCKLVELSALTPPAKPPKKPAKKP